MKTKQSGIHSLRLISAFIALYCSIWAVAVLPLTTAITLGFAQVLFVTLIALYLLRESVGIHRIGAVIAGFVGVMAGAPLFWLWVTSDLTDTLFLLAMGVITAVANEVGVKALRLGEASVVGNIQYMQLVYAAILGFFLFNEIPDVYTMVGAFVIIGSSIYIFHREILSKKQKSD